MIIARSWYELSKYYELSGHIIQQVRIQDGGSDHIENLTFQYCIVIVCVSVRVFRRQQKSQGHEILAWGLILAYLKHDKAWFFIFFYFLRILGLFSVFNKNAFFVFFSKI